MINYSQIPYWFPIGGTAVSCWVSAFLYFQANHPDAWLHTQPTPWHPPTLWHPPTTRPPGWSANDHRALTTRALTEPDLELIIEQVDQDFLVTGRSMRVLMKSGWLVNMASHSHDSHEDIVTLACRSWSQSGTRVCFPRVKPLSATDLPLVNSWFTQIWPTVH